MPDRGEIWLADLSPRHGTEPGKTRPVLIIQCSALLEAGHPSILIIPLTTNIIKDAEPLRVHVQSTGKLKKDSDLLIDQLRAVDNVRLINGPLARLSTTVMKKVDTALKEVLELE